MVRGSAATSYTYAATPHFEDAAQPQAEWEQLRVNVGKSWGWLGAFDCRWEPSYSISMRHAMVVGDNMIVVVRPAAGLTDLHGNRYGID